MVYCFTHIILCYLSKPHVFTCWTDYVELLIICYFPKKLYPNMDGLSGLWKILSIYGWFGGTPISGNLHISTEPQRVSSAHLPPTFRPPERTESTAESHSAWPWGVWEFRIPAESSLSCYPLVMSNSLPWYRWPIEIDGLPIKTGDVPWRNVK